jgi:hypothetical protein
MTTDELKSRLEPYLRDLVEELVPGGEWRGNRYCAGSTDGGRGNSFSFNTEIGIGGDFAEDERMYDIVELWQRVKGVEFRTACNQLLKYIGEEAGTEGVTQVPKETQEEWESRVNKRWMWAEANKYYERQRKRSDNNLSENERENIEIEIGNFERNNIRDLKPYDWAAAVNAYWQSEDAKELLVTWRGYSTEFAEWMGDAGLIGLHEGRIAFPVQDRDTGLVTRVHYLADIKDPKTPETKNEWRYSEGKEISSFVFGYFDRIEDPAFILIGESQWDLFALLDVHSSARKGRFRCIATRGKNGVELIDKELIPPKATVFAVAQNDNANAKWLKSLFDHLKRPIVILRSPADHKDLNDWVRHGGATEQDTSALFRNAEVSNEPDVKCIESETFDRLLGRTFWLAAKNQYYYHEPNGTWLLLNRGDLQKNLAKDGLFIGLRGKEIGKMTDEFTIAVQRQNQIDWAGEIAGYRIGITMQEGKRCLIIHEPTIIDPNPGKCDFILSFVRELLPGDQSDYFFAWLQHAYNGLRSQKHTFGQVVVLIGPAQCGKSFLQHHLITPILGGRSCDPFRYLSGSTNFNADLARSEHQLIEDQSQSQSFSRDVFADGIKRAAANISDRVEPKGLNATQIRPLLRRLTVSLNAESRNLAMMPVIDGSLKGKLMIFSCERAQIGNDAENQVKQELSHFVHRLINYQVPANLPRDQRFSIGAYIDEGYRSKINDSSDEETLRQLIFLYMTRNGKPVLEGYASVLHTDLLYDLRVAAGIRSVAVKSNRLGMLLGHLCDSHPTYFQRLKRNSDGMRYRIILDPGFRGTATTNGSGTPNVLEFVAAHTNGFNRVSNTVHTSVH